MGAVCSAGMVEKNAELGGKSSGFSGKLKKENNYVNRGEIFSDSRSNTGAQGSFLWKFVGWNQGFRIIPELDVNHRGSFLGKASERAVEVLDTLGSGMPKLNTSSGFVSGTTSRGKKISVLAFEVANTITKGTILLQSLSEENIQFLKMEVLQSEGVQLLVSTDMKELISLAEADKREEFNVFSREVARFGNMCKDPQWHNLDRYFSRLHLDAPGDKQYKVEAEKTMQEFTSLTRHTAMILIIKSLVLSVCSSLGIMPGESITMFQSELKHQRKFVRSLKKKSLWTRNLEEIVEKLVDIVIYIHQAIYEFLGNHGTSATKFSEGPERLGEAGLALHYANIINQINMIASRPTALPPNTRDTLYHGLPNNIKTALPSQLQTIADMKELSITQIKAEIDKILQWLVPFATNTVKAHQGFGWVGEWANTSNDFGDDTSTESNLIRLQTLYYADKRKIDIYIIELLAWLHHLISFVKSRQNTLRPMPIRSPPKGLELQSKMRQFLILSVDSSNKPLGSQISQEDRKLLEEVIARRKNPGLSKSEDLGLAKKRQIKDSHVAKSAGSSPAGEFFGARLVFKPQNHNVLDIMDGLGY
uniref:DUF668 domain-containing protein n=1 Tax=Cajanus cajan TaxID=3821 RepID=A0A151RUW4_CAJCA|nr:hypothetical protein KK1_032128 [Cajanus cajan]